MQARQRRDVKRELAARQPIHDHDSEFSTRTPIFPTACACTTSAAGAGPLILFVHGFPEFWYEWKDQLAEFARDHLAVALDMRGYNLSSKPREVKAYRAKHLVEDLRLLIDHLGGRPCVMVAHDWGGAVAWSFAALHPDYLSRLVDDQCAASGRLSRASCATIPRSSRRART